MIYHNYLVRKIIPNKLIYKSSEPSIIKTKSKNGILENHCNAYVYVDFKSLNNDWSKVCFAIVIQMPNYLYKLAGRIIGGKKAKEEWQDHLKEELTGFRDQFYLANNLNNLKQKNLVP